jgi:hypothetical protein
MIFKPPCEICGKASATIEIVQPNELPQQFEERDEESQARYKKYRDAGVAYETYRGPGGGNGNLGDPITPERAQKIISAFSQSTPTPEDIRAADFYDNAGFCLACAKFYCYEHWNVSDIGYGHCPAGHGASLDPQY